MNEINDPKEREHYTVRRQCGNCKRRQILKKLHKFQDEDSYCPLHKKKFRASNKENGTKCGDFIPFMTPEEVKEETLMFRRIFNLKSKKQLGRERQELCRKIQKKQTNETTGRLGIRREPLMVPVCDECGGQLKHGFRIGTVECTNCGKIWEDEPVMQDFRS